MLCDVNIKLMDFAFKNRPAKDCVSKIRSYGRYSYHLACEDLSNVSKQLDVEDYILLDNSVDSKRFERIKMSKEIIKDKAHKLQIHFLIT